VAAYDALGGQFPGLETHDSEGEVGNRSHITRVQRGHIPTSAIAHLPGVRGEVPGEHRNKQGEHWDRFKGDIAEHGIKSPVFITVDYGESPKISEGNHRRDAAVELGHSHTPVEIRYFGHAEKHPRGAL
jgi:hypothetical protein